MGEATGIQGRWWPGSFHLPSVSVEFGGLRLRALGLHRRHANTCQLLVDDVSTSRRLLGLLDELLVAFGVGALDHPKSRLVAHVIGHVDFWSTIVEVQGRLPVGEPHRIESVDWPNSRVYRTLLLCGALSHVVAMGYAVAISHNERWAGIAICLQEGLRGLSHLGPKSHAGHIDMTVHGSEEAQVFLPYGFSGGSELRGGAQRRRLGLLSASVRVDLSAEYQHVHIAPARENMIEAAVADVVGPSIATDQPYAFLHQIIGKRIETPPLGVLH